jgi:hypothetical protein
MLGDPNKARYVALTAQNRFTALRAAAGTGRRIAFERAVRISLIHALKH